MFDTRPYALIVDADGVSRRRLAALLKQSGFVVVTFGELRGALAALVARPVDIAIIAGQAPEGEDALALARQVRACRPGSKVLFVGPADAMPAAPGPDSGHAVTRPFDNRRVLSAVFELLSRGGDIAKHQAEAEMVLMAARLACLRNRQTGSIRRGAASEIAVAQAELTIAAQRARGVPPEAA